MLKNVFCVFSDLDTELEWQIGEPFTIQPEVTKLKPGEIKSFKATFKPQVSV